MVALRERAESPVAVGAEIMRHPARVGVLNTNPGYPGIEDASSLATLCGGLLLGKVSLFRTFRNTSSMVTVLFRQSIAR